MKRTVLLSSIVLTLALLTGISPTHAVAALAQSTGSQNRPLTVTATGSAGGFATILEISYPAPSGSESVLKEKTLNLIAGPNSFPGGGGSPANVTCNQAHSWSDSDGTFTYQHVCGGSTAPWGFKISAALRAIINSLVHESGMFWNRNGIAMPRQAPHVEGSAYQFHGTFNPLTDGNTISYTDDYTFTVDVGGNIGNGDLTVDGTIHQLATS